MTIPSGMCHGKQTKDRRQDGFCVIFGLAFVITLDRINQVVAPDRGTVSRRERKQRGVAMATETKNAELIEAIRNMADSEFDGVTSYSGRGMYGKECIAVACDDRDDMVEACVRADLPRPTFDTLGMGMIAYWPRIEYSGE